MKDYFVPGSQELFGSVSFSINDYGGELEMFFHVNLEKDMRPIKGKITPVHNQPFDIVPVSEAVSSSKEMLDIVVGLTDSCSNVNPKLSSLNISDSAPWVLLIAKKNWKMLPKEDLPPYIRYILVIKPRKGIYMARVNEGIQWNKRFTTERVRCYQTSIQLRKIKALFPAKVTWEHVLMVLYLSDSSEKYYYMVPSIEGRFYDHRLPKNLRH